MKKELKEISLLKTVMMLTVVLYHSCLFYKGDWFTYVEPVYHSNYIKFFTFWLSTFHIQTFTLASGYLFFYLKTIRKNLDIKEDIKKRAKRLLLPLICTEILWVIPFYIYYNGFNVKTIIGKFILLESPSQLWFLPMLFLIFIFYSLTYKKIKFSYKNLIITYLCTVTISTFLDKININVFNIANAIRYSLYFYLGGYIFYNRDKINKKNIKILIICTSILLIYAIMSQALNIKMMKYLNIFLIPILSCLESTLLYKFADYIVNIKKRKFNNKFYNLLQENCFGIYLFHQQIIYVVIILCNGLVYPIVQCFITFIIFLICALAISVILRKNEITKKMFAL